MRIRIHNHSTPGILKQLISGRLDFAVITMLLELEEIKKYPWIGLGIGSATHELHRNFFIEHKIDIEPDMEVATPDLMLPLIESNLGISFVKRREAGANPYKLHSSPAFHTACLR